MKNVLGWILLSLLIAMPAYAADKKAKAKDASKGELTLKQALKEAFENSPYYQRSQALEREAGWGQLEAVGQGFIPHLSLEGRHYFAEQYSFLNVAFGASPPVQFPGIYPYTTFNLNASWDLFDGFRNFHETDAADRRHEAAKTLVNWSLFQVQERVRLQFYQSLAAKMLEDLANEDVKTLEDHLRIVKERRRAGQATKYDVLRVEVQLSQSESDQMSTKDQAALAREALFKTIGLVPDDRNLSGKLPLVDAEAVLDHLPEVDTKNRPDVKAKILELQAAQDQKGAAEAFGLPHVSLIAQYQFYNSPDYLAGGLSPSNDVRTDYFLGVAGSWDVLDGGVGFARAKEAAERAKATQAELDEAMLQAPYDLDLWKRKLASSAALYQSKTVDVEKAKESARLAKSGFKAGANTTTDVLDAELETFRAGAGLVQAQLDMLEAQINLELAIGKRLDHE